ncbi:MAG: hypothetical protein ABI615_12135, partial [Chthoniobacterales bacterium]
MFPATAALDTTFNAGDIILGFRTNSGTGSSTTIMVNLGAASLYRDATSNILNVGNIGTLLNDTYGIGGGDGTQWYDRTSLYVGLVAATNGTNINNSGSVAVGQDPNSTVYLSARRTAVGTVGSAQSTKPGNSLPLDSLVQPAGARITTLGGVFDANDLNAIANIASSTTNSWNSYTTGTNSSDINSLFNIESAFASGSFGSFGASGAIEMALDLYR